MRRLVSKWSRQPERGCASLQSLNGLKSGQCWGGLCAFGLALLTSGSSLSSPQLAPKACHPPTLRVWGFWAALNQEANQVLNGKKLILVLRECSVLSPTLARVRFAHWRRIWFIFEIPNSTKSSFCRLLRHRQVGRFKVPTRRVPYQSRQPLPAQQSTSSQDPPPPRQHASSRHQLPARERASFREQMPTQSHASSRQPRLLGGNPLTKIVLAERKRVGIEEDRGHEQDNVS